MGHFARYTSQLCENRNDNDFDGLNRVNGTFLIETTRRLGLQTSWNYFRENVGCTADHLVIGDVNLMFRFAQNELVQMRTGLGARFFIDDARTDYGFNFSYGADWFLRKPWVVSLSTDLGTVGSAFDVHTRATAGVLFHGAEFFAGYDVLRIGSVNLQGAMIGLRYWF